MADTENKYLNNRLKYHTASRVAISTAYSLMQSTNPDGHTVTKQQIWTAENNQFPKNTGANKTTTNGVQATEDLVNVFTNNLTAGNGASYEALASGGQVWTNTNYPAVKLYYQAELSPVAQSDNMAWELLVDNARVMDWVAPTTVKDNGLPVPGYTGIVEATTAGDTSWSNAIVIQNSPNKSYGWELAKGNWEFVYMSGMVTFHPDYIPSAMSYGKLRLTAFAYNGTYLSDTLGNIEQSAADSVMAIKPFVFSAYAMQSINEGADLTITIPGIVFNVFNNETGIVYGDIQYITTGNDAGKSIITIEDVANTGLDVSLGGSTFTAMAFVLSNGNVITMLPSANLG